MLKRNLRYSVFVYVFRGAWGEEGGPLCVRPRLSVCLRASCPAVCALMVVLLQVLQALLTAGALNAAALIRDSEAATGQRGRVQDNN